MALRGDKVVMRDMNARVGNKVSSWYEVMGKHGEEVENDSGRRLLSFCTENDLRIMNTHFEHKRIHKFTGDVHEEACTPSATTSW